MILYKIINFKQILPFLRIFYPSKKNSSSDHAVFHEVRLEISPTDRPTPSTKTVRLVRSSPTDRLGTFTRQGPSDRGTQITTVAVREPSIGQIIR